MSDPKVASQEASPTAPQEPELLPRARVYELLSMFGITETDTLKHTLEDHERWTDDLKKGFVSPTAGPQEPTIVQLEAIRDEIRAKGLYGWGNGLDDVIAQLRQEAPAGRAVPHWQSMDMMPEAGQVIVCWADDQFDTIDRDEYSDILGFGETPAKGWMPLPSPPAPPTEQS